MHKLKGSIPVPCGKCPVCLGKRISSWSFRLMQEYKISSSAHFLTLTYDTATVPITKNGFMGLNKRDVQLFLKRLRKANDLKGVKPQQSIKYYCVGEYGGRTKRPHYHIIIFNCDIKLIQSAWQKGSVHYGKVSEASVGYTMKYISKPSKVPMHRNDDRDREFSLMSKGLGLSYLSEKMIRWHRADIDNRMYCMVEGDKKISMPRYYKEKVYNEYERKRIGALALLKMEEQKQIDIAMKGYDKVVMDKVSNDLGAFKNFNYKNRVETRSKV